MSSPRALEGVRVVDCATLFAGPVIATVMGDFGADVVKLEHPRGDTLRTLGWQRDGVSLWWAVVSRNKRCVTAKLADPEGADLLRALVREADVLIENFRPGTLERWGLAPEELQRENPGLVVVRTTGFGQTGPYRDLPGFGTLAEAISGFAHMNGWPDKPPALPPFALGDGIAALTGCALVMTALWWREHGGEGRGQVIDLSIFEPLFWVLGPHVPLLDELGVVVGRSGNAAPFTAPRNAYATADGVWLALSASAQSIAERVMRIVGRPELVDEPWFADHTGRVEHAAELDDAIASWIGARSAEEVLAAFRDGEAAIAPIYSVADIVRDPHYRERGAIETVEHPQLGPLRMQGLLAKLSETPGEIRHPGPELGEHNEEIYVHELGVPPERLAELREKGVI